MADFKINKLQLSCVKLFFDRCISTPDRKLSESMISKIVEKRLRQEHELNTLMKICEPCRRHLDRYEIPSISEESSDEEVVQRVNLEVLSQESLAATSAESVTSNVAEFSQGINIETFNKGISAILTSPIDPKKIKCSRYVKEKCDEIVRNVRRHIFGLAPEVSPDEEKIKNFDEVIDQLIAKFKASDTTKGEQLQILTVLPRSWTVKKIMDTFGATKYMAQHAKQQLEEKGVLTSHKPSRVSIGLSDETKEIVTQFYESDDISRAMPGKNDYVSIRKEGKRQLVQKRLLMSTLRESYVNFVDENGNVKMGFSTFAKLRPDNCKLLTSSGTHNVCVCTIHENVNLIIHSLKKYNWSLDLETLLKSLMCKNITIDCRLRLCENCKDTSNCEQLLITEIEEKFISEIRFEQWVTTDRCYIDTLVKQPDDFVSYMVSKLEKLIPHDFIKTQQSTFLKKCKTNLKQGEFVVTCDFSENYTFVLQDEVQSHHWNAQQATIHPFVIYYKNGEQIEHLSFVVISEDLRHDSIAVNLFVSKMIEFLQVEHNFLIKKLFFISDGAASQYKNRKNFASLCQFKNKYKIEVEWHFFATSHGKGPCDAIGGTLKRMATRASLAKEREHPIKNAKELCDWAQLRKEEQLTKISFCYTTT